MKVFIRRREAANMLGVHERTLMRWHEAGLLRSIRIGPRLVGYDPEEIQKFLEQAKEEKEGESL